MSAILDRQLWTAIGRVMDASLLVRGSFSIALAAAATIATTIAPIFLAQLVDALAAGLERGAALPFAPASLYLFCLAGGRLIGHVQSYYYMIADQHLQRRISQTTLQHVLGLSLGFHLGARAGSLLQIYQNALQGARIVMSLACASLLPIVVQLVVILSVVASLFDLAIWLLVSVTVIAYACVFTWNIDRVSKATAPAISGYVEATGRFSDAITNIEAVKSNTAENRVRQAFAGISRDLERVWRISFGRRLEAGLAVSLVFSLSMATAIYLGLERVQGGQLSAGGFVLLTAYMIQIISPLETTGYALRDLSQGVAYLSDWKVLLGERVEGCDAVTPANDRESGPSPPAISFENVSFGYNAERPVLRNIVLDAEPGGMLAIVGPTGIGKTSLLRLLQKHLTPDAGSITINGRTIADLDTDALRRRISIVSQDVVLFNDTLLSNLMFANPDADGAAIAFAVKQARLEGFISTLPEGLKTIVGERGLKLSGGERQRVAIARAILRGGDILLLDEATSSLDARTERDILAGMMRIADGRTTIVVTHRLPLAALATRIAVLREGRVVETGRHDELLARGGAYAALWEAQAESWDTGPTLAAAGRQEI